MTIHDVIDFVHEQRAARPNARIMERWSDGDIAWHIAKAIHENAFGYVVTGGKLTGIAFGYIRPHEQVLDVLQVVCATSRDLAHLLLLFKQQFPGWKLRGRRKKKAENRQLSFYHDVDKLSHKAQAFALTHS